MKHGKIIVVAGPAGGGKTSFAGHLAQVRDLPVVATDDYKHLPWAEVTMAVGEVLVDTFDEPGAVVILEGVRALSVVKHMRFAASVAELYWVAHFPEKPKTSQFTTQQRNTLAQLRGELPEIQRPVFSMLTQWSIDPLWSFVTEPA